MKILFVCTGNICRSPTAEGILRHLVNQVGMGQRIDVDSAGTHGDYHQGEAPDPRSLRHAARRGYDLKKLRARRVLASDFVEFDLLIGMDNDNMAWLTRSCPPPLRGKLRSLMQYASNFPGVTEVPDPYVGGDEGFEQVLDLLEDAMQGLLRELNAGAGGETRRR